MMYGTLLYIVISQAWAWARPTPRPRLPTPRPRLGVDARSGSPRARALAQNAILTLGSRWGRAQNLKKTRCAAKKGRFRAGWARKRARARAKTKILRAAARYSILSQLKKHGIV